MIKICIVEDEKSQADLLTNYIRKYDSNPDAFSIEWLEDGMDLVDDYKGQYDIIFLDIQMKHLDGMAAAEKIRKVDSDVIIIFITSTVQYAVQGYAVDALGYVLKPVPYEAFRQLLDKTENYKSHYNKCCNCNINSSSHNVLLFLVLIALIN